METKFRLGNRVKDIVTGFTGIATAKCEYLNGCIQYCVKPPVKEEDKMPEGIYIDEGQLEFVDSGLIMPKKETGGPQQDTPRG